MPWLRSTRCRRRVRSDVPRVVAAAAASPPCHRDPRPRRSRRSRRVPAPACPRGRVSPSVPGCPRVSPTSPHLSALFQVRRPRMEPCPPSLSPLFLYGASPESPPPSCPGGVTPDPTRPFSSKIKIFTKFPSPNFCACGGVFKIPREICKSARGGRGRSECKLNARAVNQFSEGEGRGYANLPRNWDPVPF